MKRLLSFALIVFCFVFVNPMNRSFAGKVLYDDFSNGYLDGDKWFQRTHLRGGSELRKRGLCGQRHCQGVGIDAKRLKSGTLSPCPRVSGVDHVAASA